MAADPALAAVKTSRYLRVGLVALVLLLFSGVAREWAVSGCLQPSISAYVHTPAQPVLVGSLVGIGVALLALQGSTEVEGLLLNVAGMLAPGVAFIPTTTRGECLPSAAVGDPSATVSTSMPALFVAGAAVGVFAAVLAVRERRPRGVPRADRVGLVGTAALLGAGAVWFALDRDSFLAHAHGVAAVPMFLAVIAVVWLNAREAAGERRRRYVAVYRTIAVAMLGALALAVVVDLATAASTVVLWVEVVLILLFGVFWVVQTVELWSRGLRRS
ncbi:hypothetical protein KC207_03445 [Phycicoccus sp. BSK3Z-2]|uniref:DUF998 domain-containing protein n=1 Tax=Phycicoccus avicenniae TaxID=2828860 RepID=A0A941D9I6_9MICO|nr:hypothetical protein [Phycicoccus avicenniae]MBR7742347.1 hypothetical protein [Phycicoccus avicenniae]